MNSMGALQLEGKKEMKARGAASPDAADAIAVTFYYDINTKAVSKKPMLDRMRSKGAKMTLIGAQGSGWMN